MDEALDLSRHSWWLRDALDAEEGEPAPALRGDIDADILVIGGGYTGLWSAYFAKEADPSLEVVVLEAGIVGGGPSGRNGGFVNDHWEDVEVIEELVGAEAAARAAELSHRAIAGIDAFCTKHDVNAWYVHADHVGISTSPSQDGSWEGLVASTARLGAKGHFEYLSHGEVQDVAQSAVFRDGVAYRKAAMVQPARLVRGLRRAALGLGVKIYEDTPVRRFKGGAPAVAETPAGTVTAPQVILGVNAWAAGWKQFKRQILPRASYIVLTEPAPDKLKEIGWTGEQGIFDFRSTLDYVRTTRDGRIAFGAASSRAGLGTGMGPRMWNDERTYDALAARLVRWFPNFEGVRIEARWGGPIDVTGRHVPIFGSTGYVHYAHGYTGGGVGPSWMGGKILSGLARGVDDEFTNHPLINVPGKNFPPEPILSIGAFLTHEAIVHTDDRQDLERRPNPLLSLLARIPRKLGYNLGAE